LIGERLVLGSCALDGTIRTWDPVTGGIVAAWSARNDWPCALADAAAGGVQRWATGGADGVVRIWDAATGRAALTLAPDGAATAGGKTGAGATGGAGVLCVATALLPGHTLVAAGYGDGSFRVWDAVSGTPLGVDMSSTEPITSVEFGRDGGVDVFVCGTAAGSVRVYDPATAALRHDLSPHTDQVLAVAAGPDGLLVSGGADHTVRLWDAGTGWPLRCLRGHTDLVTAVAVGRFGETTVVVSGGYDRTVRVWDAATGAPLHTNGGARSAVYALAIGETGGRVVVAAGGYDDALRVLDLQTGNPVLATDPVAGFVRSLALGTRDGREILVAAAGNVVRCWALPTGSPLWTIELADPPLAVAIGPDGEVRALGTGGHTTAEPSA
jgi:WD40 repeat protein